jgi:hypothetical protein
MAAASRPGSRRQTDSKAASAGRSAKGCRSATKDAKRWERLVRSQGDRLDRPFHQVRCYRFRSAISV